MHAETTIRPMQPDDVDEADHVMRIAFGTHLGMPEPSQFFGDAEVIRTRFAAAPDWAFAAEQDGRIVGSNMAMCWGSFGFFGPLTVHPDLWNSGIAKRLMEPVIELFAQRHIRQSGLFTFADSSKHVSLYHRFGYWPENLTAIMGKPVSMQAVDGDVVRFSAVPDGRRQTMIGSCRDLTHEVYDGLELTIEIEAVVDQRLGDTVLLCESGSVVAFAVCHCGAGEAGSQGCYIKFGVVRPGSDARERFEQLLRACEALAYDHRVPQITAGMSFSRSEAYDAMLKAGYRAGFQGVRMLRPNIRDDHQTDVYLIDDLR